MAFMINFLMITPVPVSFFARARPCTIGKRTLERVPLSWPPCTLVLHFKQKTVSAPYQLFPNSAMTRAKSNSEVGWYLFRLLPPTTFPNAQNQAKQEKILRENPALPYVLVVSILFNDFLNVFPPLRRFINNTPFRVFIVFFLQKKRKENEKQDRGSNEGSRRGRACLCVCVCLCVTVCSI